MSKRTDLTGRQVGELTVLRPAPSRKGNTYWYCSCSCGRECSQPKTALISDPPKVKSCGCLKEDYISRAKWAEINWKKYVFLRPIAYFPRSKQAAVVKVPPFWLCLCDGGGMRCSAFVRASTADLKRGRIISCTLCMVDAEKELDRQWEAEALDEVFYQTRRRYLTRNSYDCMLGRPRHAKMYTNKSVCPQWQGPGGFEQFVKDMELKKHGGLTLERVDPTGNYEPSNCKWADRREQDRNKTNSVRYLVEGEVMHLVDLATAVRSTSKKVKQRIDRMILRGFTPDEAAERIMADWRIAQHAAAA